MASKIEECPIDEIKEVIEDLAKNDIDDVIEPPDNIKENMKKIDFSNMSQEQINGLVNYLSKSDFINPNTNKFSQTSEEQIRKEQLKQKMKHLKEKRLTKRCRNVRQKKKEQKIEEMLRSQKNTCDTDNLNDSSSIA